MEQSGLHQALPKIFIFKEAFVFFLRSDPIKLLFFNVLSLRNGPHPYHQTSRCVCEGKLISVVETRCFPFYFASTTKPDTQSDDLWARWPAKLPCHLFSFMINMHTNSRSSEIYGKINAPKPDTKTPMVTCTPG